MIYFHFTTRQFSSGAPITSASLALSVYKDDGTTQSTSGITTTFTTGFDGVAGLVSVKIDTSSDGTFYAAAHDFSVVVTTGTADSVSIVGEVVGYFSIENRSALMPTTAARKVDVSAGGEVGIDWANVGSPTTAVDLSGTTIKTTQKVDVETIKTQAVTAAAGVTFPTSIASPTNITAGTITTATNLTNAPTNGDFTAAMKTSIGTAVAASAVASVTAEVTANVAKISGSAAAADALEESTEAIGYGTVDGTGATSTVFLSSALTPDSAVNDQFNGRVMIFKNDTTTAALRGQATTIGDYAHTSAEIGTFTVTALTTAPQTGDTFAIL